MNNVTLQSENYGLPGFIPKRDSSGPFTIRLKHTAQRNQTHHKNKYTHFRLCFSMYLLVDNYW